jgi:para-nitrobenzyl esterase
MRPPPPQVKTTQGLIEGFTESGLAIFKGVPYAAPPVNKLRWQPPQPAQSWSGVRPAIQFGPSSLQNPSNADRFKEFVVEGPQSEDCLYLNIWTPGCDDSRRPVMVWIHGGLFTMGAGSQSVFDGANLALTQNVVVVTINYRLGCLGFLNLNIITRGSIPASGDEGLLDQIAALEWLQDNIVRFGGDSGNITLFGESAGGSSVECLLCMPAARGLFHKAIMQSNIHQFVTLDKAEEDSQLALAELNINPAEAFSLLKLPGDQILAVQKKLSAGKMGRRINIAPVVDGHNLPTVPLEAFRSGREQDIPLIIGTNREETRLFQALRTGQQVDEDQVLREVINLLPGMDPRSVINAYRRTLANRGLPDDPVQLLVEIQTDIGFRIPALELLKARCSHHSRVFAYEFNWQSPALGGILGACHGMEIGFIFGHYDDSFCGSGKQADLLSRQMQQVWANFARCGRPSSPAMGEWPQYCEGQQIKLIGSSGK